MKKNLPRRFGPATGAVNMSDDCDYSDPYTALRFGLLAQLALRDEFAFELLNHLLGELL